MSRRPYRVEVVYPKIGAQRYFLVRDVRVGDRRTKVSKYLKSGDPPTHEELERFRTLYAYELELRAAEKSGELSLDRFTIRFLDDDAVRELEQVRYLHQRFTELMTVNELERYEGDFEVHYVQGTTSIEGNTFTVDEARALLLHGVAPRTKSIREINEVQNFAAVRTYREKYRGKVTIDFIKKLHALIMHNIDHESAGAFRRSDGIGITGCDLMLCPASEIPDALQKTIDFYYRRLGEGYHPFEEAMMFHYFFEAIHPFTDGNGRVGREVLNFMLKKSRYPRLLFLGSDRDLYIEALLAGNQERYAEMVSVFASIIVKQRRTILLEKLKEMVVPIRKEGQRELSDFFGE